MVMVVLAVIALAGLYVGNKRLQVESFKNEKISFYYRDTLDLNVLFPAYRSYNVRIDTSCSAVIFGRKLYFEKPEKILLSDIKIPVVFQKGGDKRSQDIYVRCWKDSVYQLAEVTEHPLWEGSKLKYYYDALKTRLGYDAKPTVVGKGDTLFSTLNGNLCMFYKNNKMQCGSLELESPNFNQVMGGGNFLFLRTNNKLYVSTDDFISSKLIYDDRRGIKESMYWNSEKGTLVYSMYTPGKVRKRHYLLEYNPSTQTTDTIQTFYTTAEHDSLGLMPFCRHIHLICKDPYTGDLYVGTGDSDEESAVYRSSDGGHHLQRIGGGSQMWRTLSFFFTKDYVFWTTDSDHPQYISRLHRDTLTNCPVPDTIVTRYPLFNSALWCNIKINDNFYLLGSNSEGSYYDDFHRIYGLQFSSDGIPTVYSLIEEKSIPHKGGTVKFHQIHPLCKDYNNFIWCYDNELGIRKFMIEKKKDK
jgi:hypothetical protein